MDEFGTPDRFAPRPNRETQVDRDNETFVIQQLKTGWKNFDEAHKLRPVYHLDYALLRGGDVHAFTEIKCRPRLSHGYGNGYRLSLSKALKAKELEASTGRPCFFACWLADGGIYWRHFDTPEIKTHRIEIYGRKDISWNLEPCVVFPWETFRCLMRADTGPAVPAAEKAA